MMELRLEVLVSLAESSVQLKRFEKAIGAANEGIEINDEIARLHFIVGFSTINLFGLLNLNIYQANPHYTRHLE